MALVFCSVSLVFAGVDSWTDTTLATGVVWRQRTYTSLFNSKQTVNVLQVDLAVSSVTVRPIKPSSGCQKTSTLGSNAGAIGAINGGFFDSSCASLSMIKINGTVSATNPSWKPARSTLGLKQNTSSMTPYIEQIASSNSWSTVNHALGGGPNLVSNGAKNITLSQEGFDSSYANRHPRTAVGFTSANKLLLVIVDGRTSAGAGMTLDELAQYMIWLGCTKAMNLDGGGSSTMWVSGRGVVNTPSDGSERSVASALGVWVQATEVIVDNTSSGFSASSNWWTSTSTPGYYGTNYHTRGTAAVSDSAKWTVTLPTTGSYKVYAQWAAGSNRAPAAPYVITHSGGNTTVNVNQQANGGKWNLLGTWNFSSGTAQRVQLSCWTTTGYYVIADAVKFVKQ
jgi:hypothetical protein